MIDRTSVPVVLLHAFPLDARMWDAQVAALEQTGYETIAPNLPGREPDNDLADWAGRVLQLLAGDFIPVGCSMGGYLIFELWRQASARIPAAVFIDTRAGADTPEVREGRDETIRILGEDGFDAFWKLQEPKLFGPDASPDVVERARAIAGEQPITNLVATIQALGSRPDSRETASSMGIPASSIRASQAARSFTAKTRTWPDPASAPVPFRARSSMRTPSPARTHTARGPSSAAKRRSSGKPSRPE